MTNTASLHAPTIQQAGGALQGQGFAVAVDVDVVFAVLVAANGGQGRGWFGGLLAWQRCR